jgi:hypothetical protein
VQASPPFWLRCALAASRCESAHKGRHDTFLEHRLDSQLSTSP